MSDLLKFFHLILDKWMYSVRIMDSVSISKAAVKVPKEHRVIYGNRLTENYSFGEAGNTTFNLSYKFNYCVIKLSKKAINGLFSKMSFFFFLTENFYTLPVGLEHLPADKQQVAAND
uniref:Uncharacterized protein n=1 Tax=Glossina austeni TaxID=7395 RepID=A0A1A9VAV0_GLOAU